MPRDLAALVKEDTLNGMPALTKSPDEFEDRSDAPTMDREAPMDADEEESMMSELASQRNEKRDELHPYTQSLTTGDIESCVRLEEATFPPQERCTREKFQYRLSNCGELSLGIFNSQEDSKTATAETSAPVYSGAPQRKAILLGHVIATKTTNETVTDNDMSIPKPGEKHSKLGHKEEGRTICIHSLAVLPDYQRKGLGKTLMKAYIQRMESHGVADKAALITHEQLIPYYEALGFVNKGKSDAQFGGGGWFDMVMDLKPGQAAMA